MTAARTFGETTPRTNTLAAGAARAVVATARTCRVHAAGRAPRTVDYVDEGGQPVLFQPIGEPDLTGYVALVMCGTNATVNLYGRLRRWPASTGLATCSVWELDLDRVQFAGALPARTISLLDYGSDPHRDEGSDHGADAPITSG